MRGICPSFAHSASLTILVLLANEIGFPVKILLNASFPTDKHNEPIHSIDAACSGKVDNLLVRHAIDRSVDLLDNSVDDSWNDNARPCDNWNHGVVVFQHCL